jgi:hypothetical protein
MSIEIYNKAKIIKKDDKYYYFLKHHSKNDCICGGQVIVDDNFNNKYIARNSRAGSWSIKAIGNEETYKNNTIAKTEWNCPTSYVYGQIMFGNKKNIALYWVKCKVENYNDFTDEQKYNIGESIKYAENDGKKYVIDLTDIKENELMKKEHFYCDDTPILIENNYIKYNGQIYWNLDNL